MTDDCVYMRTVDGPARVDVIYRRIDDLFLDPEAFLPGLDPGRARAAAGLDGRQRGPGQCPGGRGGGRQGGLRLRAGDHPLLSGRGARSSPTSRPTAAWSRRPWPMSWSTWSELVVKPANESGGYGMLVGPASTKAERERVRRADQGRPAQLHRPADAAAVHGADPGRAQAGAASCGPAPLHPLGGPPAGHHGRADPGGPAQGLSGGQLLPGRRQQGHLDRPGRVDGG